MFTFNKQRAFALVPKAIGLSLITALAMTFTACSNDNPTTEPGGKKTEPPVEIPFLQTKEIATGDYIRNVHAQRRAVDEEQCYARLS